MYTIDSIVKINAWIPPINTLKPCHAQNGNTPKIPNIPEVLVKPTTNPRSTSPANKLPNKLQPSINVLANSSTILILNKNQTRVTYDFNECFVPLMLIP